MYSTHSNWQKHRHRHIDCDLKGGFSDMGNFSENKRKHRLGSPYLASFTLRDLKLGPMAKR